MKIPTTSEMRSERLVWAHLLTPRGWVLGAMRVPKRQVLLRFLNGPGRFIHLAKIASGWGKPGAEMVSIRKEHLLVAVPQADERVAPSPARGRGLPHEVTLLFAKGHLTGLFDVGKAISPVSFLERSSRFVVVERGTLHLPGSRLPRAGPVRAAIVNAEAVVGILSRRPAR